MHTMRVGIGKVDALDLRRRNQPRDVLRVGAPPNAFIQVVRNASGDQFVRQQLALVFAVEPDNVKAVARRHRRGAQLTGRQRDQRLLQFDQQDADQVCPVVIWPRLPPCAADEQAE